MSNCNCNPKKYNLSMGCCQPVLAPIENYYTKYQIDQMLSGETSGCCITPEEVDEKIESAKTEIESEIPSLSGYATEQWVEDKHYISGVDLSDYALKSEIPTSNSGLTNDAGYITGVDLSNYATLQDIPVVPTSNTAFTNDANYITSADTITYVGSNRINVSVAAGVNKKQIDLNVPVYSGSGVASVSLNNPSGTGGGQSNINGMGSLGAGYMAKTSNLYEAAFGTSNQSTGNSGVFDGSSDKTLFSVGNGANNVRHNTFEIRQNGDIYIANTNASGEYYNKSMIKLQEVLASLQNQIDELRNQIPT